MSGPPPTPLHLRLMRGNPSKRPLHPEPEPARDSKCPEPPSFITGYAADEYWRAAPELWQLGLLTVLDVAPFCAYCTSYRRWRLAEEAIARMAEADKETRGLLVETTHGETRLNPLVKIAVNAAHDMVRYAAEFGCTPVARARIAAGPGGQPPGRKFEGLLDG